MGVYGLWSKTAAGWCALAVSVVLAQAPGVQTMSGFRVPDYDREGRLKSQLFGDRAEFLPGGDVRIINLRIEMYENDDVAMRVTSPLCIYREQQGSVESDSTVRIAREDMVVTGSGFTWDGENESLLIRNDARVVLMGSMRRVQTGENR